MARMVSTEVCGAISSTKVTTKPACQQKYSYRLQLYFYDDDVYSLAGRQLAEIDFTCIEHIILFDRFMSVAV